MSFNVDKFHIWPLTIDFFCAKKSTIQPDKSIRQFQMTFRFANRDDGTRSAPPTNSIKCQHQHVRQTRYNIKSVHFKHFYNANAFICNVN